jgi:hypothetical protein
LADITCTLRFDRAINVFWYSFIKYNKLYYIKSLLFGRLFLFNLIFINKTLKIWKT